MLTRRQAEECPCRNCLPPKRRKGCHGGCLDWETWHDKIVQAAANYRKKKHNVSMVEEYDVKKFKRLRRG